MAQPRNGERVLVDLAPDVQPFRYPGRKASDGGNAKLEGPTVVVWSTFWQRRLVDREIEVAGADNPIPEN